MGAGVGLIGVVGVATLLAVLFRGGGGSGTGGTGGAGAGAGSGPGSGAATTQSLVSTQPTRPMKVRIDGSNYVVDGRSMDLAGVTDLAAKVPPGEGAAVVVERPGTSRAKAEEDLFAELDKRGVKYMKD
jgi:hypothetical protein